MFLNAFYVVIVVIFEDKIQYQEMVARKLSLKDFWQKAR